MNEREKRERASREREQEREEARAKPAREEKKSVLFSRERERERAEPAAFRRPALVHCQLESEGETPCPGGARELCLGRERERERVENVFRNCSSRARAGAVWKRYLDFTSSLFSISFKKKTKKNSAASVAALLVAGSALTAVSAAPQPGSDEDVQSREADYSHFAEM